MSNRRFEYSDEKSHKFWEITVDGNEHTVRYGRIGADGQSKTKSFDDAEAAAADAEKLIKSKTKKGYEEVAGGPTRRRASANSMREVFGEVAKVPATAAPVGGDTTPAEKVRALLMGLCKTDEDEAVLEKLCEFVTAISADTISIEHGGYDWEVNYEPATAVVYNDYTPRSFSAIAGVVSSLTWDAGGPEAGYEVGENGESCGDEWLYDEWAYDDEEGAAAIAEAGDVSASFHAGQNGLFFDPTSKLANGEPGLAFLSHEGGGWETCKSVQHLDYGQILLRLLSDSMVDTNHVKEVYF